MRVDELISQSKAPRSALDLGALRYYCSQFINESEGIPIYKALPNQYSDVHKVKARLKRKTDKITTCFNKAFIQEAINIRQRAVFAYPTAPSLDEGMDLFYVFPIDNYKFLYSNEVTNSDRNYNQVIDTLFETFEDTDTATTIVTDLLKYTYSTSNLHEGLGASAEIIFYNIPYYYAIRVDACSDYKQLIT
jgi:hypothetical protein